jgi:hypothetical protein
VVNMEIEKIQLFLIRKWLIRKNLLRSDELKYPKIYSNTSPNVVVFLYTRDMKTEQFIQAYNNSELKKFYSNK